MFCSPTNANGPTTTLAGEGKALRIEALLSIKPNVKTVARAAQAAWSYELAGHGPALWELRGRRSGEWVTLDVDQRERLLDALPALCGADQAQ